MASTKTKSRGRPPAPLRIEYPTNPDVQLAADDPRWQCRQVVEYSGASADKDAFGIGTTPYQGDVTHTGVRVPTTPAPSTNPWNSRWLIRLAGLSIEKDNDVVVCGLRQYATLRSVVSWTHSDTKYRQPVELEILSSQWAFQDGNIAWLLRYHPEGTAPAPGFSAGLIGTGDPGGQPVEGLGVWRDMRFPWQVQSTTNMREIVPGPGSLVLYASVKQTDPETRPNLVQASLTTAQQAVLSREDQFVLQFPTAIYGRVAGAILVNMPARYCRPRPR